MDVPADFDISLIIYKMLIVIRDVENSGNFKKIV
jgi:hypothetical protein